MTDERSSEIDDDHATQPVADTFWEAHYQGMAPDWGTEPNVALQEALARIDHDPTGASTSRALDLGAGHGGDSCWLAELGWQVTATDVSATALSRIEAQAVSRGLDDRLRTEVHDLTKSMPTGDFELITASYLHLGPGRPELLRRAWARLVPDGVLLLIDHASAPPWSWADPDTRFSTPQETLDELELDTADDRGRQVHVERLEAVTREATGPDAETAEVVDNVIVVRSVRAT